jgi:hypothetical protein
LNIQERGAIMPKLLDTVRTELKTTMIYKQILNRSFGVKSKNARIIYMQLQF